MPLVSIIIPTYKNRGNLTRAIDSCLGQTYKNLEIIVVDDNNSDDEWRKTTEHEMCKYADNERVVYLKHKYNKNGSAARNTGIKAAKGKFISLLDDDDYFEPNKTEKQIEYLLSHPEFDAVYCQCKKNCKIVAENLPEGNLGAEILLMNSRMQTLSLVLRKEAVEAINGFDESFKRHQDYEFLLRFFRHGFKIGVVNEPLAVIGVNQGENIPRGQNLESLKKQFLNQFQDAIRDYSKIVRNYRGKVYAKNYGGVFIAYIKERNITNALRIMFKYAWYSPIYFFKPLINSVLYHLKR